MADHGIWPCDFSRTRDCDRARHTVWVAFPEEVYRNSFAPIIARGFADRKRRSLQRAH